MAPGSDRSRAEERLRASQEGLVCARDLSDFHDTLIEIIHDLTLVHIFRKDGPVHAARLAVVATGGYGRGLMAPGSDIDLLFIQPARHDKATDGFIEYILYILWDLGFKVGHATRTVAQCIQQAQADHTIRTALLDARLVLGDNELYAQFQEKFRKDIHKGTSRAFIEAKLEERNDRHNRAGRSRYLVEPNVKDGKGGLRDLHTLHWLVKYIHPDSAPESWVETGLFSRMECETFRTCEDFLWGVRCNLHFLAGKAEERLSFDVQPALADAMGYRGDDKLSAVERFMRKDIHKGTSRAFIEAKLEERNDRHNRAGRSRYLVEPNVKDGKGGLRDLHTLHWLVKYIHPDSAPESWVETGLFSRMECETFRTCEDFLWGVRCNLHFLAGKAEERLSFDVQPALADAMGYRGDDKLSAVERFMKHYFGVAKAVGDLTRIVIAQLEVEELLEAPRLHRLLDAIPWPSRDPIEAEGFVIQTGRLQVTSPDVFKSDPVNLIRMFALAEEHNVLFHPEALRLARASLTLINDAVRNDPKANKLFLDLLTSPGNAESALRKMNEAGVLGQFIPDFGLIVSMMQFNMYHHFTVDEHLIQAVGLVSDIDTGQLAEDHPLSTEIMVTVENTRILYVALLLHDIAKGRNEDHSIAGARVARELCPRFGLSMAETETVAWLIEQHLVMSHFSQTRDVHDPKTARDLAQIVQSPERLKLLLVLTVADIRAVGPGVWTGWKGQLLRDLYYETMPLLTGGYNRLDLSARAGKAQKSLREKLGAWSQPQFDAYVERLYPPYWLKTDTHRQVLHAWLIEKMQSEDLNFVSKIETDDFTEMTDISVCTQSHPRLLEQIAGACAVAGANILGAQITTTRDGMALDTITIQRDFPEREDELRRARRIIETIENLVRGEARLSQLLAARQRSVTEITAFTVEPQVVIDNTLSQNLTVIEVNGLDRMGLLYDLTRTFVDLKLVVRSAHITTFGEKAVDVFYVTDMTGMKIKDTNRHDKIRQALYPVLEGAIED